MLSRSYPSIRLRWLALAAASAVLLAAVAYVVTGMLPPQYASRVTLLVGPSLSSDSVTLNDVLVGQALAPTYAQLAVTRPILERASQRSGITATPDDLANAISTLAPANSSLVEVTVTYGDPDHAAALANAIATELVNYAASTTAPPVTASPSPGASPAAKPTPSITLTVIDPAVPATKPERSRTLINTALGGGIRSAADAGSWVLRRQSSPGCGGHARDRRGG